MKKFFSFLVISAFFISSVSAYRDVSERSDIYIPIQRFIEAGVLEKGTFFRGKFPVPHSMFWPIVLKFSDVEIAVDESFELPIDFPTYKSWAPAVREAMERNFIDPSEPFSPDASINQFDGLKTILRLQKIAPARRLSRAFQRKTNQLPAQFRSKTSALGYIEAGLASGILTDKDLKKFNEPLSREDLVKWLYRYQTEGRKQSKLEGDDPKKSAEKLETEAREELLEQGKTEISVSEKESAKNSNGVFESIIQDVMREYRFSDEIDKTKKEEMLNVAIRAMIRELGDKYSDYIPPAKKDKFFDSLQGSYEGIGAYVDMIDGVFTITAPLEDSPAEKAGIKSNDQVTHVDGEDIRGQTTSEVVSQIKGPAETEVTLTILRDEKELKVSVIRGKFKIPAVEYKEIDSVPVITISNFNASTPVRFKEVYEKHLKGKSHRGIVFDLRKNTGGYLRAAVQLLEMFSDPGEKLFIADNKNSMIDFVANNPGPLSQQPNMVVLQSKVTASAAEIFNVFLQETGRATVLGVPSRGKGTIQKVMNYSNGSVLKLTTGKWLTPNGNWIHEEGVQPDITIESRTDQDRAEKRDPGMEKAIRTVLNG